MANEEISVAEEVIKRIKADEDFRLLVSKINVQDIPYILERVSKEDISRLVRLLPDEIAGKVLPKLPTEILEAVVLETDRERLNRIASSLPADELSDFLEKLPSAWKKKFLMWLPHWKWEEVKPLLVYPPETAGGLMTNKIPIFFEDMLIEKVVKEFRVITKFEQYDTNNYIYAVDSNEKLKGVISSKELLLSAKDKKLQEVASTPLATVTPDIDQEQAAKTVAQHDLIELPVVDKEGKLLGAITVDDIIDVIVKENSEDFLNLAATVKVKAPYLAAKVTDLVKNRVMWLVMLCLIEVIVAFILGSFEKIISTTIALAFFIPLVSATGGNSGVQTSTLIIRELATGNLSDRDLLRILVKESMVSTLLIMILAPFLFVLSLVVTLQLWVSLALALAIIIIIFVVNLIGGILPLAVTKIKVDPATISAPLITTVSDAVGLTIYFLVAILILL